MNKQEFIAKLAEKTGESKAKTQADFDAALEVIKESLAKGEKITFVGFGSFEVKQRAATTGRNPRTGEPIDIPASKQPAFKAGKELKEAVNK